MSKHNRTQKCCYLSTPEHIRSFIGRVLYIYTAKGELQLTAESLIFSSKKTSVEIPIDSITDINSGSYSRFAKPIRLDYMAVTYNRAGNMEAVLLTPTQSWATPVWNTNKQVASWIETLNKIIHT